MERRRIILTNLNSSVFSNKYISSFLAELVINSLLYDQVLIREGDLICNRHLTSYLSDHADAFEVFADLLRVGAVRLLRVDPKSLSSDLERDPIGQPVSARAEDHMRHRSYAGRDWKPRTWEWKLYERLDDVLKQSNAFQIQKSFQEKNVFAAELKNILVNRDKNGLQDRRPFRDINDHMADKFIAFCSDPEAWRRFVSDKGGRKYRGGEGGFYRTAGYQCLQFFEHRRGMERLLESTYAACDSDREDADGRYGRSALAELPFAYPSDEEQRSAVETVIKMEVVPVGERLTIGIAPGIGEVVAAAREHPAFCNMQSALESLGDAENPDKTFTDAWQSLCSVVADNWARKMGRRQTIDHQISDFCVNIYLAFRFLGYVVLHGKEGFDWPVLADKAIIDRIEHWVPELSKAVRSMVKLPRVYEQFVSAATLRCSRVPLSSGNG
jgi:hypothetical protein